MRNKIFIGIVFILTAALIIADAVLDATGIIPSIPIFKIALSIPCVMWAIKAILKCKVSNIVFPLSFILLLFEKEIGVYLLGKGEDFISNWIVLLSALLLTIGLELIEVYQTRNKIFIGIVFILTAALIIADAVLDATGIIPSIPIFKIALSIPCVMWAIKAILKCKVSNIVFPLSFILLLFEKEIGVYLLGKGEDFISNWIVLLSALLLTIGLELIFGDLSFKITNGHFVGSSINKNSLGEGVKYIDCASFKYEVIRNNLGQFDIYFQNLDAYEGGGTIEIINKLGKTNVYLPDNWSIEANIISRLGESHVYGNGDPNGKIIKLIGVNKLGEVNIHVNKI